MEEVINRNRACIVGDSAVWYCMVSCRGGFFAS